MKNKIGNGFLWLFLVLMIAAVVCLFTGKAELAKTLALMGAISGLSGIALIHISIISLTVWSILLFWAIVPYTVERTELEKTPIGVYAAWGNYYMDEFKAPIFIFLLLYAFYVIWSVISKFNGGGLDERDPHQRSLLRGEELRSFTPPPVQERAPREPMMDRRERYARARAELQKFGNNRQGRNAARQHLLAGEKLDDLDKPDSHWKY